MGTANHIRYYPKVDAERILGLQPGLWLALGGALLVILDITVGARQSYTIGNVTRSTGWQIDFLPDVLGYLLVLLAVGKFKRFAGVPQVRRVLSVAFVVFAGSALLAVGDFVVGWREGGIDKAIDLLELLEMCAWLSIPWSLSAICEDAGARRLAEAWRRAFRIALIMWGTPLCLAGLLGTVAWITGAGPWRIELHSTGWVLVVLGLAMLPLVFIAIAFVATLRFTAREPLLECHVCGYPTVNLSEPRCPECGTIFATELSPG